MSTVPLFSRIAPLHQMHALRVISLPASAKPLPLSLLLHPLGQLDHVVVLESHLGWFPRTRVRSRLGTLATYRFVARLALAFDRALAEAASALLLHLLVFFVFLGILHIGIAGGRATLATPLPRRVPLPLPSPLQHLRGIHSHVPQPLIDGARLELRGIVVPVLDPAANLARERGTVASAGPVLVLPRDLHPIAYFVHLRRLHLVEALGAVVSIHVGRGVFLVQPLLLLLQQLQFGINVRIDVVGNVLPVQDLGHGVEAPLGIGEVVPLAVVGGPHARSAVLPH
mmetsp:Transcript_2336/g.5750  ORF Transcript_2336/g.5750 Transcript_2336/m.5750 type:complete len:284 (-) Transcript_2336:1156-2007(-)